RRPHPSAEAAPRLPSASRPGKAPASTLRRAVPIPLRLPRLAERRSPVERRAAPLACKPDGGCREIVTALRPFLLLLGETGLDRLIAWATIRFGRPRTFRL